MLLLLHRKNPTYAQAQIKLFARQHGVLCKAVASAVFCCLRVKLENKEHHHGGFQQQNTQRLVDRYEHMNRRRKAIILRLKAMPVA